jgi:hypothetical protein
MGLLNEAEKQKNEKGFDENESLKKEARKISETLVYKTFVMMANRIIQKPLSIFRLIKQVLAHLKKYDSVKEFTKEAYGGENQIPATKEFREAFEGVGDKLGEVANNFIMGNSTLEEVKNELLNSVMNESIDLNMATRLNNVIESFNKVTERGEKFQNVLGTTPDNRYPSWEEHQRQQTQRGQTTISGQVAVGGTINIKVDSPSNLTEQQVFNIFNNPEVQTQMFKIIKGMSEGLIKPLEKK